MERQDANFQAYNSPVTARLLLGGHVDPPSWALPLIKTLEACTGMPGHREWIDDDITTPGGSYVFGGVSSPGPATGPTSFLRKKKKMESLPFPPPSWEREDSTESYFTQGGSSSHARNMTWDGSKHPPASRNFDTQFDSEFLPDRMSLPYDSLRRSRLEPASNSTNLGEPDTDPFDSTFSVSGIKHAPDNMRANSAPSIPGPSHTRSKSLKYDYSFFGADREEPILPSIGPKRATTPFLKPRSELATPLSPSEGVARAIALYNFDAVEVISSCLNFSLITSAADTPQSGDLSFRKGDVIVITKKSDSTNDWY